MSLYIVELQILLTGNKNLKHVSAEQCPCAQNQLHVLHWLWLNLTGHLWVELEQWLHPQSHHLTSVLDLTKVPVADPYNDTPTSSTILQRQFKLIITTKWECNEWGQVLPMAGITRRCKSDPNTGIQNVHCFYFTQQSLTQLTLSVTETKKKNITITWKLR